jgi:hypothetical protein
MGTKSIDARNKDEDSKLDDRWSGEWRVTVRVGPCLKISLTLASSPFSMTS